MKVLVGRQSHSPRPSENWRLAEDPNGFQDGDYVIISHSRFSVLASDELEEIEENKEREIEEGEVVPDMQFIGTKAKDSPKGVKLSPATSLKLSKQLPACSKDFRNDPSDIKKLPLGSYDVFHMEYAWI